MFIILSIIWSQADLNCRLSPYQRDTLTKLSYMTIDGSYPSKNYGLLASLLDTLSHAPFVSK